MERSLSPVKNRSREHNPSTSRDTGRIQGDFRTFDSFDSDTSDMRLAKVVNTHKRVVREASIISGDIPLVKFVRGKGQSVSRDVSPTRSPSPTSRDSRRAKSRSKSVPREVVHERRRSSHRADEVSPRESSRKHRSRSCGRYNRAKSRSPARGRSPSRSPPRTRERISRARSSTRRRNSYKKSSHSRSGSRSRSRSPFQARRTRTQSRSPIRRRGTGKYTAGNKYKRAQSVPRDTMAIKWATFGSPSTEDSSSVHSDYVLDHVEDVPMLDDDFGQEVQISEPGQEDTTLDQTLRDKLLGGNRVVPVVPLVDVLSDDEASQNRRSRNRYKYRPGRVGQNCSVVVKALSGEDIERSRRKGQHGASSSLLTNTSLAPQSASRDSSQTSFYSDSSVSPRRRKTRASSQDSIEDASQDETEDSKCQTQRKKRTGSALATRLALLSKEASIYQGYRSPKPRKSSRSPDRSVSGGRNDKKGEAVKQGLPARSKSADRRKTKQSDIYKNKYLSNSGKSPRESSRSSERGISADAGTGDGTQQEKETQEMTSQGKRRSPRSAEGSFPFENYKDDADENTDKDANEKGKISSKVARELHSTK